MTGYTIYLKYLNNLLDCMQNFKHGKLRENEPLNRVENLTSDIDDLVYLDRLLLKSGEESYFLVSYGFISKQIYNNPIERIKNSDKPQELRDRIMSNLGSLAKDDYEVDKVSLNGGLISSGSGFLSEIDSSGVLGNMFSSIQDEEDEEDINSLLNDADDEEDSDYDLSMMDEDEGEFIQDDVEEDEDAEEYSIMDEDEEEDDHDEEENQYDSDDDYNLELLDEEDDEEVTEEELFEQDDEYDDESSLMDEDDEESFESEDEYDSESALMDEDDDLNEDVEDNEDDYDMLSSMDGIEEDDSEMFSSFDEDEDEFSALDEDDEPFEGGDSFEEDSEHFEDSSDILNDISKPINSQFQSDENKIHLNSGVNSPLTKEKQSNKDLAERLIGISDKIIASPTNIKRVGIKIIGGMINKEDPHN